MSGVFISYRRDDSGGYAGRLFDVLAGRFGHDQMFMDLDDIHGGDNFAAVIDEKVGQCNVLLAVIGERWLTLKGQDGVRRLDVPGDFVRLEIAKALERGVRVVPVLVGGAAMPGAADLPEALQALTVHQAIDLRDAHFHADANQLIDLLQSTVPGLGARRWQGRRRWLMAAVAAVLLAAGLAAGFKYRESRAVEAEAARARALAESVAGKWTGTVKYDWGESYTETFEFELAGGELSGTASYLQRPRGILDGKLEGNRVTFTTKSLTSLNDKTFEDTHRYRGTIDGRAITFTLMTDSGAESHVPVRFTVQR
jgi:TIR domain